MSLIKQKDVKSDTYKYWSLSNPTNSDSQKNYNYGTLNTRAVLLDLLSDETNEVKDLMISQNFYENKKLSFAATLTESKRLIFGGMEYRQGTEFLDFFITAA